MSKKVAFYRLYKVRSSSASNEKDPFLLLPAASSDLI